MKIRILFMLLLTSTLQAQHWVDLTYSFDQHTIYWPTEQGFELKTERYGMTHQGYFYSSFKLNAPEHGGTHVDAPRHFSKKGLTVDQIQVKNLTGNAMVIDVRNRVAHHPDYAIRVKDIQQFETSYRPLQSNDIVLFYTGWGAYWKNKKKYLGTDVLGDVQHLHFPGISKEAARYLVAKHVRGIGIDTASMDPGVESQFWAHRIILGANLFGIENVAQLNRLPPVGATLVVAPMKIAGGSGAPARILALMP